jgi:UDP-GlcNAc:undecaprenyl-phosphate/decaprenyl-phosphate GlcNAc-1-phosphate transferase
MATFAAFLLSFILVPATIYLSRKLNLVSRFSDHRVVKDPTPLLGGAAVFITFAVITLIFNVQFGGPLVMASLPIFILGILDDFRDLKAKPKFFLQLVPIIWWAVHFSGGQLIFEQAGMPTWAAIPVTIFWITAITNGVNLIDGMDGVCAGTAFFVALMLSVLSAGTPAAELMLVIAVAILGFLFFNLPKAKIYLGNNGSYTIGFILAAMSVILTLPSYNPGAVAVPLMLLAFPQVDTLLAMVRRLKRGKSLFQGDHEHIHHKLLNIGLSPVTALIVIFFVNAYAATAAFVLWKINGPENRLTLILSTFGLIHILFGIYYLENRLYKSHKRLARSLWLGWLQKGSDFLFDAQNFSAIVINLDHVYPNLQPLDTKHWESFTIEMIELLEHHFEKESQFSDLGDDQVVAIVQRRTPPEGFGKFFLAYEDLLKKFNIPSQHSQQLPLGLGYFSSSHRSDGFIKLIRARDEQVRATA